MSWFTEDSTPAIVVGVIVELLLILALVKTGRRMIIAAIGAVALLVAGIVLIEKNTVTDTKLIRGQLDQGVAALKANDLNALLALLSNSPSTASTRPAAAMVAREIHVDDAWISGVDIQVNRFHNPPSAVVELTGHLTGKAKSGLYP